MARLDQRNFAFLYRTDKGRISRETWWHGTAPLIALTLLATIGWVLLAPYAHHDLAQQAFIAPMTIAAYLYLLTYAFGLILVAVCEYNLSAKRFRDRGLPGALAAILPLSVLFGSALIWFIPQSFDSIPLWVEPLTLAVMVLVAAWNILELGVRTKRIKP